MNNLKRIMQIVICIITITGCTKIKPIPYLNNGEKWDKSIVVLGDWDDNPETPDTYLHWAPVNVGYDASGEVGSKYDHRVGRLFQWGSGDAETNELAQERYYDAPKDKWYNKTEGYYTGDLWNNAQGPCPNGWRLPTAIEFKALMAGKHGAYGWTTSGNYAGMNSYKGVELFGMNKNTTPGTGVFLPAAGLLDNNYGRAYDFGEMGGYWTSNAKLVNNPRFGEIGITLSLYFSEESCAIKEIMHSYGYSVRCVRDVK